MRGYIAMLATREDQRGKGIASKLVRMACDEMIAQDADEVSDLQTSDIVFMLSFPDRPGNRSRQRAIFAYLRESRFHSQQTITSILPQRQYCL